MLILIQCKGSAFFAISIIIRFVFKIFSETRQKKRRLFAEAPPIIIN